MSKKARKDGVVSLAYDRLLERASSGVFGSPHRTRPIEQAMKHLADGDYIGRVDIGTSWGMEVLVRCFCSSISGENHPFPLAAGDSEAIVMRGAHRDGEPPCSVGLRSVSSNGVKSESAQKPVNTVELARDYFPQIMAGTGLGGIRLQSNWPALARNLKLWKINYGASVDTIQHMMEEFARHPEWIRQSNKPPWRVFLARRDELAALIETRRRRDPGNRKYSAGQGKDYWIPRPTPRLNYAR